MRSRRRSHLVESPPDSTFSPFRETVLVHLPNDEVRFEVRLLGDTLIENMLELPLSPPSGRLSEPRPSSTRMLLGAAVADLRHLQRFLVQIASDVEVVSLSKFDRALCRVASQVARALGKVLSDLERRLRR